MPQRPKSKPRPVVYAFIDSQNLNLGVQSDGWRIDYAKFRLYLTNKYGVSRAYMFLGYLPEQSHLYKRLKTAGFDLVFKKVTSYHDSRGRKTVKGNVDAELVLHAAAITYKRYHKAIIISGDGDFCCLIRFLKSKNKLASVLVPNHQYSKLLDEFADYLRLLDRLRRDIGR